MSIKESECGKIYIFHPRGDVCENTVRFYLTFQCTLILKAQILFSQSIVIGIRLLVFDQQGQYRVNTGLELWDLRGSYGT